MPDSLNSKPGPNTSLHTHIYAYMVLLQFRVVIRSTFSNVCLRWVLVLQFYLSSFFWSVQIFGISYDILCVENKANKPGEPKWRKKDQCERVDDKDRIERDMRVTIEILKAQGSALSCSRTFFLASQPLKQGMVVWY